MADILPGYTWNSDLGRYRSLETGRFVSRTNIVGLMHAHDNAAESRCDDLTRAYTEGKIDGSVWAESMRDEARRLTLINEALPSGGWEKLSPQQLGRAGGELRERYARISANAEQFQRGEISQKELMARTTAMIGEARMHYWKAEREAARSQDPANVLIERRILSGGGNTCSRCVDLYNDGWQHLGILPVPADGSTPCRGNDKCRLERREVPAVEVGDWIGTKR